ncbi:MAG: hypothetical protein EZS28_023908, partial [Streblomastix strix]
SFKSLRTYPILSPDSFDYESSYSSFVDDYQSIYDDGEEDEDDDDEEKDQSCDYWVELVINDDLIVLGDQFES